MSNEERINYLKTRIDHLNDSIQQINLQLTQNQIKLKRIHKKVEEKQSEYENFKNFVSKNDPTGIHLFDPENMTDETLAKDISEENNKVLHDLKKQLEDERFKLEKAEKWETKNAHDIDIAREKAERLIEGCNKYVLKEKKYDMMYYKSRERKRGRIIYIPLAIILFIAGSAISLPVGIFAAVSAIGGTVLVRNLLQKAELEKLQDQDYNNMTKKQQRLYELQEIKSDYKQAKESSKPENREMIAKQKQEAYEEEELLRKKRDSARTTSSDLKKNYDKSVKKFNSYLTTCQEKQDQMHQKENQLNQLKEVEDDSFNVINQLEDLKRAKQDEVQKARDEIEQLTTGKKHESNENHKGSETENRKK